MNSPIEIISGIWISDFSFSYNKHFLNNNNIDILINCTCDKEFIDLETIKYKIKVPFQESNPSKYNIMVINDYMTKVLDIMYKSLDTHNILIYSYSIEDIPLTIVSAFIVKYGNINETSIENIIKTKINTQRFNKPICIDLSLYKDII